MPPPTRELDDLLESVLRLARERPGRLLAITLSGSKAELLCGPLRERLVARRHPEVEVRAYPAPGPVRVSSAEYDKR